MMVEFLKFVIDFLHRFYVGDPDPCLIIVLSATFGKVQGTQIGSIAIDDIDFPMDEHIIDTVGIRGNIYLKGK